MLPELAGDDVALFNRFVEVGNQVFEQLKTSNSLQWRLVPLVPTERYELVRSVSEYPSLLAKTMSSTGLRFSWSGMARAAREQCQSVTDVGVNWLGSKLQSLL